MLLTPVFALLLANIAFAVPQGGFGAYQQHMLQAQNSYGSEPQGDFNLYDGSKNQIEHEYDPPEDLVFTLTGGQPYFNPYASTRVGRAGPLLLQNTNLIEQLAHFVRERVPERQVHAKGFGAHGYFEVTTDIGSDLSMAKFLSGVGKRTPVTARFSTIAGSLGAADSVRDLRGMAFKFRTEDGILDWVLLNHPIFWLRDPGKFPHFIHSQKRHPAKNVNDHNDFWDYLSDNPESISQVMRAFSDLGTPYGFRHMDGFAGNTFRAVNKDGIWHYIKITFKSEQGIRTNTLAEATKMAGENPDFGSTDLWDAIERGDYPKWTVYWQIMSATQAERFKYNIFDLTKEWLPEDVPLLEIGRVTLDQNIRNHHQEVEQASFDPAQMPPGLEPSEDPVLQARLFAYSDAARARIGINYKQLPINCPLNTVASFGRDGAMSYFNQGDRPNYASTVKALKRVPRPYNDDNHTTWIGGALQYVSDFDKVDYEQARGFWQRLSTTDQDHLVSNVIAHLGQATNREIRQKQVQIFTEVDATLGRRIAEGVNVDVGTSGHAPCH